MSVNAYANYKESGVPWLGTVPDHWDRKPLFALVRELDDGNDGMKEDNLLSLSYGQIKRKNIGDNDGLLPASFETYQIVENDDVVWRLTDLQNDQRSLRTGIVRERGIITSAYLATRPTGIVPEFLAYLLRAYDLTKVFYSMGGGLRQSMKFSDVKWLPVMLPCSDEQRAIVGFLNRETAKIDVLVAEQQRLITLLKEKRQAVISRAVIKGLNPHIPMKDSGIEWLGEIPLHWTPLKLGRAAFMQEGPGLRSWQFTSDGTRVICVTNITDAGIDFARLEKFISNDEYSESYRHFTVQTGDILLSSSGNSWGKVAIYNSDEKVILNTSTIRLNELKEVRLINGFIGRTLQSDAVRDQLDLAMTGACQPNFGPTHLNSVMVAVPPVDEQNSIVEFLSVACGSLDNLIREAQSAISLMQERRAALISAAVTGKIDVRALVQNDNVISIASAHASKALPSLRSIVGAYAVVHFGKLGRMAVMKAGFLAEAHAGLHELNGRYARNAAGPYDGSLIAALERGAGEHCGISTCEPQQEGQRVTYTVPTDLALPSAKLTEAAGPERAKAFENLLALLNGISREGVEAIATIYAVWNDLLADAKPADDDAISTGVLTEWHSEKAAKFKRDDIAHWLAWMRRNSMVPNGTAPRTDHQGSLFA